MRSKAARSKRDPVQRRRSARSSGTSARRSRRAFRPSRTGSRGGRSLGSFATAMLTDARAARERRMRGDAPARPGAGAAAGAARRARAVDRRRPALARVLDARRVVAALRRPRPQPRRRRGPRRLAAAGAAAPRAEARGPAPARLAAAARAGAPARGRAASPRRSPAAPSLVVLGAALALLAPLPLWHHAPGPRLAFQTTTSRLLVWRDGIPASFEPLLPLEPVGAHAPALATLAADVSLLTGVDPGPALARGRRGGRGAAARRALRAPRHAGRPPRAAALGSLVALAVSPWPGFLSVWGEGEALLALGLPAARRGAPARSRVALLGRGRGAAARRGRPRPARCSPPSRSCWRRPSASVAAGPSLPRPGGSPGSAPPRAGPGRTRPLAPRAGGLGARGAGDRRPPAGRTSSCRSRFGLLLAALAPLAFVQAAERRSAAARAAVAGVSVLAALLLVARVHGWFASGQLSERTRAALARAAARHDPARVDLRRRRRARLRARSRGPPRGRARRLDPPGLRGRVGAARETAVPRATRGPSRAPVTTFDAPGRNYRAPRAYKGVGRGSARLSTG